MKVVPWSVENWLQQHNVQCMLRVHQDIPFDDLSEALAFKEAEIFPEWIRATLDLTKQGSLDEEAADSTTLKEFLGPYSHTAKGFCCHDIVINKTL